MYGFVIRHLTCVAADEGAMERGYAASYDRPSQLNAGVRRTTSNSFGEPHVRSVSSNVVSRWRVATAPLRVYTAIARSCLFAQAGGGRRRHDADRRERCVYMPQAGNSCVAPRPVCLVYLAGTKVGPNTIVGRLTCAAAVERVWMVAFCPAGPSRRLTCVAADEHVKEAATPLW